MLKKHTFVLETFFFSIRFGWNSQIWSELPKNQGGKNFIEFERRRKRRVFENIYTS